MDRDSRGAVCAQKQRAGQDILLAATKCQAELVSVCFNFIDFGIAVDALEKFEKSEWGGNYFHYLPQAPFQFRKIILSHSELSVVLVVHFRTVSVTYPCDTGVILWLGGAKNDCDWCSCRSGLVVA